MLTFGDMIYILTHKERILSTIEGINTFIQVTNAYAHINSLATIKENLPYIKTINDLVDIYEIDDNLYEDVT